MRNSDLLLIKKIKNKIKNKKEKHYNKYNYNIFSIHIIPSDPLWLSAEGFTGVTEVAGCEEKNNNNNKIKVIKKKYPNRFLSREIEKIPEAISVLYALFFTIVLLRCIP